MRTQSSATLFAGLRLLADICAGIMTARSVLLFLGIFAIDLLPVRSQERNVTLHTNFFYWGPIKETFSAYSGGNGKLVKHGRYREWEEDGSLWHEIDYKDGKVHGAMVTFYPNGQKASETAYAEGKPDGSSSTWNRDGLIVARGTNRHGAPWSGQFANETSHSIRSRGDEDIRFYITEYKDGTRLDGPPQEIFDDGAKWKPPPKPINYRRLLRWNRYSYSITSSYPYLEQLPPWSEIPVLLGWINSDRSDAGVEVAYSQLVAMSRAKFGHPRDPPAGGMSAETLNYYRTQRRESWAHWWETVGKHYEERLRAQGQQALQAWKIVSRDYAQPLPALKVALPDEWVLSTSYRAGDYGGIQTEAVTLRRTRDRATLIRALRKSTWGRLEWEQWQPLTVEQADIFALAVAYAVDHPWLLKPKDAEEKSEGRNFTRYCPGFHYALTDLAGNVWWNDDPRSWHGAEDLHGNFMNTSGLGSVCLLLWRCFPENQQTNGAASWKPVVMPDSNVVYQAEQDLRIPGEIIEAMWNTDRLRNGLSTLTEFGALDQIPALTRLETELPAGLEKVRVVLDQDPNGASTRQFAKDLLSTAAKAKAEIQRRSDRK